MVPCIPVAWAALPTATKHLEGPAVSALEDQGWTGQETDREEAATVPGGLSGYR